MMQRTLTTSPRPTIIDHVRRSAAIASLVTLALLLVACSQSARDDAAATDTAQRDSAVQHDGAASRDGGRAARSYQLGFSALPPTLSDEGYLAAFDFAAQHADVLLIQRAPAWADFLPGATPSTKLRAATAAERDALRARGLQLFIALDPFDPAARERLAAPPRGYEDRTFADPALRQAFVTEAKYLGLNHQPAYFSLGTEINATFERDPAQYQRFLAAYQEAYAAVKSVSPRTQVFVTFQYEQLLGVIPWDPPHAPRWELLRDFEGRLDLFALTSYPSFAYAVARKAPSDYYRQARSHTALPIAFASVGYASTPGRDGLNSSTASEQRRFLERLLQDADELAAPLLVWFAARDADYLSAPPNDLIASIGLRAVDGQAKEAWPLWEEAARRPYDPAITAQRPPPVPASTRP